MDTSTMVEIIIAIFAMPILAAILIFPRVKANNRSPVGLGLKLRAYNVKQTSQPSTRIKGVKAKTKDVKDVDATGKGMTSEDIQAVNKQPTTGTSPKAQC